MGSLIGSLVPVPGLLPLGFIAGGAIGSYLGKRRMENERQGGRIIEDPTALAPLLSKESALEGWIGKACGVTLAAAGAFVLGLTGLTLISVITVGAIGGTLVGVFHGADKARARMKQEYAIVSSQNNVIPATHSESAEQEKSPGRSFAKSVEAERASSGKLENRERSPQRGFTLIEMSIVLIIIGQIVGSVLGGHAHG